MNYQLQLTPSAILDLKKTVTWYNFKREGLGGKFKVAIKGIFQYIISSPKIFHKRYNELRMAKVGGFPFGVFFIIKEQEKKEIVVGVVHYKRNPKIIFQRHYPKKCVTSKIEGFDFYLKSNPFFI